MSTSNDCGICNSRYNTRTKEGKKLCDDEEECAKLAKLCLDCAAKKQQQKDIDRYTQYALGFDEVRLKLYMDPQFEKEWQEFQKHESKRRQIKVGDILFSQHDEWLTLFNHYPEPKLEHGNYMKVFQKFAKVAMGADLNVKNVGYCQTLISAGVQYFRRLKSKNMTFKYSMQSEVTNMKEIIVKCINRRGGIPTCVKDMDIIAAKVIWT
jgi:hypothetical protein